MSERSGRQRVESAAQRLGIEVEFVDRGPASSLEEAAANLGLVPKDIVKTLVAKAKLTQTSSEHSYVIALIPGDQQVDWAKLRKLAGMKKMSMTAPDEALEATGFLPGTINPFGALGEDGTQRLPVYADTSISGRICLGAGEPDLSMFLQTSQLYPALNVTLGDIGK